MTMSMQPEHTILFHDCRPAVAAMTKVVDDYEAGRLTLEQAKLSIEALASTLPGLSAQEFAHNVWRLMAATNCDRARRLISAVDGRSIRPWAMTTITVTFWALKWGAFAGLIALVVWLVVR